MNIQDRKLSYEEEKFLLENSFCYFFEKAWQIIEPGTTLKKSWHIAAIAKHLEALYHGKIKRLIINIPPRLSKSSLATVIFPVWCWVNNPAEKILSASFTKQLSLLHSDLSRDIIKSDWFKSFWNIKLNESRDAKSYYSNTNGGHRISLSVGSQVLGYGGNLLIVDDPNEPSSSGTEVNRQAVIHWYSQKFRTRLIDSKNDRIVIIQQRTHENDLSGFILKKDIQKEWVWLRLPAQFEERKRTKTIPLTTFDKETNTVIEKVWEDPRKEEGEPVISDFDNNFVSEMKLTLGTYGYAGQFQQNPSPSEGGILKKAWFKIYTKENYPEFIEVVQSWDTAISDSPKAAYSACTTWGIFLDRHKDLNFMLLGLWRGKVGFPDLRSRATRLFKNYKDTKTESPPKPAPYKVNKCIIEAKATGDPLIRDLKLAGINAVGFIPKCDKEIRVQMIAHLVESGVIHLPSFIIDDASTLAEHSETFIKEMISFPNAESRDLVDTLTQILHYYRPRNKNDERFENFNERHYNNLNPILKRFFE